MAKKNVYTQNAFYGGFADDLILGTEKTFQSAEGIDIRSNPSSISLSRGAIKESGSVVTDLILASVVLKDTGRLYAFGDTGKVYERDTGGTWVEKHTVSEGKISGAYEYNGHLYFATKSYLGRIAVGDANGTWSGNVDETYKTFTNKVHPHPMVEVYNDLYVGDGSDLAQLDNTGIFTGDRVEIFGDERIMSVTFSGSSVKIYAQKSDKVDYGRSYLWDGISDSYNGFMAWEGLKIHAATQKNGKDYVLAGTRPSLYVSNGTGYNIIKRWPSEPKFSINPFAMDVFENYVCIGAASSGGDNFSRGIYTYGSRTQNYPDAFNFDFPVNTGGDSEEIGCVFQVDGSLFMSWKDGVNYGVDKITSGTYNTTGELISRVYDGGSGSITKETVQYDISFKPLKSSESIEFYVREDFGSWKKVIEVDYDNNTSDRDIVYKRTYSQNSVNFNYLETKVVLKSDGNTTPTLFEKNVTFTPIN